MTKKRILVVDDEHLIRWSLSQMLNDSGYEVETAETGAKALAKGRDYKPHLILLDICLPDANGMDLLPQFKDNNEDVVVVMITAHSHAD